MEINNYLLINILLWQIMLMNATFLITVTTVLNANFFYISFLKQINIFILFQWEFSSLNNVYISDFFLKVSSQLIKWHLLKVQRSHIKKIPNCIPPNI